LEELGKNLKQVRISTGMTQESLAERASLGVRTLQKIEAGQINILVTTARRLKHALDCDWEDLLD